MAKQWTRINDKFTLDDLVLDWHEMVKCLVSLTGRDKGWVQFWLERRGDPSWIIKYSEKPEPRRIIPRDKMPIELADGRRFTSRTAFAQHVHARYGIAASTVGKMLSTRDKSPEDCLELARAYRRRHWKASEPEGRMVLFGWYFRSSTALCTYYKINLAKFLIEWRARASDATPVHTMPACMLALAKLWEAGLLDVYNRHSREVEARLPESCLPINRKIGIDEDALDDYERRHLDYLQKPDVPTERRHGLAWLERHRAKP